MAKDTYKATERRLYALPILREKLQEDKEKLEEIRTHGTPQHSKGIVRYSRTCPLPAKIDRKKVKKTE